jgi:hypothetical protein
VSAIIGGPATQLYFREREREMRGRIGKPSTLEAWLMSWHSFVEDNHDPGDEDRSPDGPWCSVCGDAFEGPERDCPNPKSGWPYVDCGRGGHMFDRNERKP